MAEKKWFIHAKRADFSSIADTFGIDQVTARVIRNRDIVGDEAIRKYLHGSLRDLYDPSLLGGAMEAAQLISEKIDRGRKLFIIGDYDIDGVCSTCILYRAMKGLGADVEYMIPDRIKDGYGLHRHLVEYAFENGADTIVTCDNGISAIDEIAYANRLGMTVIVTDHHQPVYEETDGKRTYHYPPAKVLTDPHIPGDPYPFPSICGAVVAWKVMILLYQLYGLELNTDTQYLELAAFATVGDVMDLQDENRIIVKYGLLALSRTSNPGLCALMDLAGLNGKKLSAYHIGFVLGPCLNAGGRLDTAMRSVELLLTNDPARAALLAQELYSLNEQRKKMTQEGIEQCREQIGQTSVGKDRVFVIYLPSCHESIAGIIAGKIREQYYRPVFVLTKGSEPGLVKGSGRSIEGYHMYEALVGCASLLEQFGGHPMAAGLSLKEQNVDELRRKLNEQCSLDEQQLTEKVMIDTVMPLGYLTKERIEELSVLEPCGKGNPKPVFAEKNLHILQGRLIGKNENGLKFRVAASDGTLMEALFFGDVQEMLAYLETRFGQDQVNFMMRGWKNSITLSVLYDPSVNEYQGRTSLQIIIRDYR